MSHSFTVIAIDGPAGAGKSTIAQRVAEALSFTLLDTGALYRAIALAAKRLGVDWRDETRVAQIAKDLDIRFQRDQARNEVWLTGNNVSEAIRTAEMSEGSSVVSQLPAVRRAILALQRRFAEQGPLVAEGRDMGTVVFPQADLKIFLTADPDARARRRYDELRAKGVDISLDEVTKAARLRDEADTKRTISPLRPAKDAVMLDTTEIDVEQVVARVLAHCHQRGIAQPSDQEAIEP